MAGLADGISAAADQAGDFVKAKAKEGAIEGVNEKIPEIKKQVREEAEKTVTPIVKKGIIAAVGLSGLLAIVISKARR